MGIQVLITSTAFSDLGVVRHSAGNKLRKHRSTHDIRKAGWVGDCLLSDALALLVFYQCIVIWQVVDLQPQEAYWILCEFRVTATLHKDCIWLLRWREPNRLFRGNGQLAWSSHVRILGISIALTENFIRCHWYYFIFNLWLFPACRTVFQADPQNNFNRTAVRVAEVSSPLKYY